MYFTVHAYNAQDFGCIILHIIAVTIRFAYFARTIAYYIPLAYPGFTVFTGTNDGHGVTFVAIINNHVINPIAVPFAVIIESVFERNQIPLNPLKKKKEKINLRSRSTRRKGNDSQADRTCYQLWRVKKLPFEGGSLRALYTILRREKKFWWRRQWWVVDESYYANAWLDGKAREERVTRLPSKRIAFGRLLDTLVQFAICPRSD